MSGQLGKTITMDANPQVTANSGNRVIYLDLLRIISAFAVVMLHVATQHWEDSFFSTEWMIRNVYDSCVRWCVPVFVMISGALFLDTKRELNVKRLYTKNIVRILYTFILWSIIYALANAFLNTKENMKISYIASDIFAGRFHLWFLKMLLGLYIVTPILKSIVSSKRVEIYFLCVAIITCSIIPLFLFVAGLFNNEITSILEGWYNTMEIKIALGYTGYFVLGHFLNTYSFNRKTINIIYVLGCFSFVCVIFSSYLFSVSKGEPSGPFYGYLNIFTVFEAVAIFLFVKQKSCNIPTTFCNSIIHFSKMSFGIYLVHILVLLDIMYFRFGFDSSTFNPAFFIPCLSLIIFFLSYLITRILYNIPYLNKLVM